jgi:hypothetical protein
MYIIGAQHQPNVAMKYVSLSFPSERRKAHTDGLAGTRCGPTTTQPGYLNISNSTARYYFYVLNHRPASKRCMVLLPIQRSEDNLRRELLGDATFQLLVVAERIYRIYRRCTGEDRLDRRPYFMAGKD